MLHPTYSPGALQDFPNLHNQYQKLKAENTVYIWKEKHKVTGQHILFATLTLLSGITLFIIDTIKFP